MKTTITVETPIVDSPRVAQVRGLFDLPRCQRSTVTWTVDLPIEQRPWQIGLVVGPSGCGKSTLARRLWLEALDHGAALKHIGRGCIVDAFPDNWSIADITELLSSVGLASPPCWLRPFGVLSTGQQFRVTLALLLASTPLGGLAVCDEYTSVVDRTVAQVGSHAVARTVRARGLRFIAVTCHEDVQDWLQPDWVYRPAENAFSWRCLQRRPKIQLDVIRCKASAWPLFAPHHYLSQAHCPGAVCFLALWSERPVAFSSWLPFFGRSPRARARASHCYVAGLPGRGHRQRAVGLDGIAMERSRLPGAIDDDAPCDDRGPLPKPAVANDAPALVRPSRRQHEPCHDKAHGGI